LDRPFIDNPAFAHHYICGILPIRRKLQDGPVCRGAVEIDLATRSPLPWRADIYWHPRRHLCYLRGEMMLRALCLLWLAGAVFSHPRA
jgi:hypothetical protein